MRKEKLVRGILASIMAIGIAGHTGYVAASSGGTEIPGVSGDPWEYIGDQGPTGNVVEYDGKNESGDTYNVYGAYDADSDVTNNQLTINGNFTNAYGGKSDNGNAIENTVIVNGGGGSNAFIYGGMGVKAINNHVIVNGIDNAFSIKGGDGSEVIGNTVEINDNVGAYIMISGGHGQGHEGDKGYTYIVEDNEVILNAGDINSNIYGVTFDNLESMGDEIVSVKNNRVTVTGEADIADAYLCGVQTVYGTNIGYFGDRAENNNLVIDGWKGTVKQVKNFNNIEFENLEWQNEGTVLEITNGTSSDIAGTGIILSSLAGGQEVKAGEFMYLVKSNETLTGIQEGARVEKSFAMGVATVGTGIVEATDDNKGITYTIDDIEVNSQTMLVAENRAVAAAFVNQGTDLISDSMDTLSRDGKYGVKTFAAVHGNRSKYDVNSDIKINGWSSIVGVGNEKNVGNGDFSWGVFYENGSGNYRTYNEFNNEFFRGDGSLVYNGGGVAARYEQDNGVYTEGSLRAGMLKSEMSNALKDGAGNSYGYKSESSYYGAHLGVGKVITLDDNKDLDIYGKFFHTYTDGDSFTVAGDKFEFDSITSDRLRVGARLTTNKENKVSTYYGLAYEYEFNGDAQMRAQNMSAPEQSLQGSSYMAEVGMNYQPDEDSPWSFDLNMRGYAGEREGGSFSVQATYTF